MAEIKAISQPHKRGKAKHSYPKDKSTVGKGEGGRIWVLENKICSCCWSWIQNHDWSMFPLVGQTISTVPRALNKTVNFPRLWQEKSKQLCFAALRTCSCQSFWQMALVRPPYLPNWIKNITIIHAGAGDLHWITSCTWLTYTIELQI